jgi:hypothetical protein
MFFLSRDKKNKCTNKHISLDFALFSLYNLIMNDDISPSFVNKLNTRSRNNSGRSSRFTVCSCSDCRKIDPRGRVVSLLTFRNHGRIHPAVRSAAFSDLYLDPEIIAHQNTLLHDHFNEVETSASEAIYGNSSHDHQALALDLENVTDGVVEMQSHLEEQFILRLQAENLDSDSLNLEPDCDYLDPSVNFLDHDNDDDQGNSTSDDHDLKQCNDTLCSPIARISPDDLEFEENLLTLLNLHHPLYEGCPFSRSLFVALNFLLSISESTASLSLAIQCIGAFFPRSAGIERLKWANLKRVIFRNAKKSIHAYSNIPVCRSCGYLQPNFELENIHSNVKGESLKSNTQKRKKPLPSSIKECVSCKAPVPRGFFLRIFPFVPQIKSIVETFPSHFSVAAIAEKLEANIGVRAGDTFYSPRFRLRFQETREKYKTAKYMAFGGLWHDGFGQSNVASSYRKNMWPVSFCFFNLPSYLRINIPNICLLALIPGPSQPRFRWILKFLFEQIENYNKNGGIEFIDEFGNKEKVIVIMATSSNDIPALKHAWELSVSNYLAIFIILLFYILVGTMDVLSV